MITLTRMLFVLVVMTMMAISSGYTADIDRTAVDFKTPSDIKWVRNAAGTNESAVQFGDPSKPGPYVVRLKWLPGNMSRPHFHPNDRFFVVLSGTWWMGTGEKFDPTAPCPHLQEATSSTMRAKSTMMVPRTRRRSSKSGVWDRQLPRLRKNASSVQDKTFMESETMID